MFRRIYRWFLSLFVGSVTAYELPGYIRFKKCNKNSLYAALTAVAASDGIEDVDRITPKHRDHFAEHKDPYVLDAAYEVSIKDVPNTKFIVYFTITHTNDLSTCRYDDQHRIYNGYVETCTIVIRSFNNEDPSKDNTAAAFCAESFVSDLAELPSDSPLFGKIHSFYKAKQKAKYETYRQRQKDTVTNAVEALERQIKAHE